MIWQVAVIAGVLLMLGAAGMLRPSAVAAVWAVARQTFTQCLRTKVAAVFGVLLAACLAALPAVMVGDGTLAGRIRTFLDYGTTIAAVLLSLVVILLSVGVVSNDVRDKHVFLVCVKPLARWQYVAGRWLGVVMLACLLLGLSGAMLYGMAEYLRGRDDLAVRPEDRRAVDTEVLAARVGVAPRPPDVRAELVRRVERSKADGSWAAAVESYRAGRGLDAMEAEAKLIGDLRRELETERQSVAPRGSLTLRFSGIHARRGSLARGGKVVGVAGDKGLLELSCPPALAQRLLVGGPVRVNERTGVVRRLWATGFLASFHLEDMRAPGLAELRGGSRAEIVAEPTIQLSYKLAPLDGSEGKYLPAAWEISTPDGREMYYYEEPLPGAPTDMPVTMVVPARLADANGELVARYFNPSPASVMMNFRDVSVLYVVGTFEPNLLKTLLLMAMGLAFLAALGTMSGSFLSFPVGCLLCFSVLPFWLMRYLLGQAADVVTQGGDWMVHVLAGVLYVMRILLPDLDATLSASFLVDGLAVPWAHMAAAALMTLAVRGGLLLLLACWLFSRRELARVQV